MAKIKIEPGDELLYHYTSISALYGILKSKEFWFSVATSMNDSAEVDDFLKRFVNALEEKCGKENADKFKELINKELDGNYPFIMSFSTEDEDAAQWERYADKGRGVCIAFRKNVLEKLFRYNAMLFNEVFYEGDVTEHENFIMASNLFNGIECGHNLNAVASNTVLCACIRKNFSFRSEKEVRAVIAKCFLEITEKATECYELINGYVRNICKLNVGELCSENKDFDVCFENLFEKVVIGPCSSQNINEIKGFIRSLGYARLSECVEKSESTLKLR